MHRCISHFGMAFMNNKISWIIAKTVAVKNMTIIFWSDVTSFYYTTIVISLKFCKTGKAVWKRNGTTDFFVLCLYFFLKKAFHGKKHIFQEAFHSTQYHTLHFPAPSDCSYVLKKGREGKKMEGKGRKKKEKEGKGRKSARKDKGKMSAVLSRT